ncbi:hypothetical protein COC46_02185 [Bacillus sp. AFS041924]|nr:hypothetical protein COC46_02185 [Bacillus sp. AFS041924]
MWVVFSFFNPANINEFDIDSITYTFVMLFLPACLLIYSSLTSKKRLMLFAFIWSIPFSFYFALTPGIFAIFGITSIFYYASYIFIGLEKKKTIED